MILPENIPELLKQARPYLCEVCEVQLADWQESANSGAWVKFRLPDETHLEIYRGKERSGRGQKWGQRYYMMLIQIDDDEVPINHDTRDRMEQTERKPMKLSQIAGAVCHDEKFRTWAAEINGAVCNNADDAAQFIREGCGIESRSYLDANQSAAETFRNMLKEFDLWKQELSDDKTRAQVD